MKRIISAALVGFIFGVAFFYGFVSAATIRQVAHAGLGAAQAKVQALRHAY